MGMLEHTWVGSHNPNSFTKIYYISATNEQGQHLLTLLPHVQHDLDFWIEHCNHHHFLRSLLDANSVQWFDRGKLLATLLAVMVSLLHLVDDQWDPANGKEYHCAHCHSTPSHCSWISLGHGSNILIGTVRAEWKVGWSTTSCQAWVPL